MKIVARIHSDLPTKFGLPRQSGLVEELYSEVVFEPEYRNPDALRGLEDFSHIWLLWEFSESIREEWSPTVRPPRLGGNTRIGVFATRSPFRPNPIGLSCVRLLGIRHDSDLGMVLQVGGADLMDCTPIYDIKPYIPYTDCHMDALEGFTSQNRDYCLQVVIPKEYLSIFPKDKQKALYGILRQDPRPSYKEDGERKYGLRFAGHEVKFQVKEKILTVISVTKEMEK